MVSTPVTSIAVHLEPGDRSTLVDVGAAFHGSLGIGPYDPVMASCRSFGMVGAALNRPDASAGEVDLRADLL